MLMKLTRDFPWNSRGSRSHAFLLIIETDTFEDPALFTFRKKGMKYKPKKYIGSGNSIKMKFLNFQENPFILSC